LRSIAIASLSNTKLILENSKETLKNENFYFINDLAKYQTDLIINLLKQKRTNCQFDFVKRVCKNVYKGYTSIYILNQFEAQLAPFLLLINLIIQILIHVHSQKENNFNDKDVNLLLLNIFSQTDSLF
jgi:hypothetical protein